MLIWKRLPRHCVMEDTPHVHGVVVSGRACIPEEGEIAELDSRGFGEAEKRGLFLQPFEALYLLYVNRLVLSRGRKRLGFGEFLAACQRDDPDIMTKFLIYRDLRNRGYVVKDGFGFGSDFRVYERGQYSKKGAKFLVFGMNEGQQEMMGGLQKKITEITQMGKEPIIAVVERRGEVIYYRISRTSFDENRAGRQGPP